MNLHDHELDSIRLECPEVPEDIVRRVGQEVLSQNFDPATWARALTAVKNRKDEALATYSRLRIVQLMERRERELDRLRKTEFRRLNQCLGVRTVRELLDGMSRVGRGNLPRPKIPFLWLALLFVGSSGFAAAALRLLNLTFEAESILPIIAVSFAGVVTLLILAVGRFSPSHVVHWLWGEGVTVACMVACAGSLMMGTKVMLRTPRQVPGPQGGTLISASYQQQVAPVRGVMAPCFDLPEKTVLVSFDEEQE
ncbi:hypothetical protein [Haloferula sargassicola]|uniref:Uncharacterized protein n=1 Tax=Haloferula sargassicola TaxID=490096 RepID=A0ABP9UV28_9BACT